MRTRRYLVLLALLGLTALADAPSAVAAGSSVTVRATINGRDVGSSSAAHPVRLRPSVPATVSLSITNTRTSPVNIRRVELSGRVVRLSFFAFDTSVGLNVPAGATDTLSYSLDLTGLRGQATGLMGGAVTVFDDRGHQVARVGMTSDVRGSIFSVYGLFGFALLLLTVLAILDTAVAIARHGLPMNRWRRGTRAMTPGIGIGLVLVFTLSAAHIAVPTGQRWVEAAVGFAVLFFALGYLTPTPATGRDGRDYDDDGYGDYPDDNQPIDDGADHDRADHDRAANHPDNAYANSAYGNSAYADSAYANTTYPDTTYPDTTYPDTTRPDQVRADNGFAGAGAGAGAVSASAANTSAANTSANGVGAPIGGYPTGVDANGQAPDPAVSDSPYPVRSVFLDWLTGAPPKSAARSAAPAERAPGSAAPPDTAAQVRPAPGTVAAATTPPSPETAPPPAPPPVPV